jgi:predicted Zn-dependent protease
VADSPRIEELRRRIQKDPASIAFAQLAEEHRRAGQLDEAVRVCRAGLAQHPAYLSARITLGRALLEMGRYDEAASEFEYVLKAAPDNLTAVRELADIQQRKRASARSQQAAPAVAHVPAASHQPPTSDRQPTEVDPVVAELEAWLTALHDLRKRPVSDSDVSGRG